MSSSVAAFDAQLDQVVCSPVTPLVIDADGLRAIDAVGIQRLALLHRYVLAQDGRISIIGANGAVASAQHHSVLCAVVFT
jgi:anti-anti-sigma regulatory factor